MQLTVRSHRAFTIVPIVLALGILLVALGVVLYFKAPVPQTSSAAYNKGFSLGPIVGSVFVALFFNAIASRIAERRSHGLAVGVCGTILLLANLAYGVNALRAFGVIKPLQSTNLASTNASPAFRNPASPSTSPRLDTQSPSVTSPSDSAASSERTTPNDVVRPIQPPNPSNNGSTSTPPAPASESKSTPSDSKPVERPVQPDTDSALSEKGVAALANLEKEVRQSCTALAEEANAAYAKMKKPVATASALKKALDDFQSLKVHSEDLEKRLRNLTNEAQKALKEAQVNEMQTMRHAMAWESRMASFDRSVACGTISRACDTAADLFNILKDHVGKWKVDASGKVSSSDRNIQSKLFGPNAQLQFALDRQKETVADLLQGDQLKKAK